MIFILEIPYEKNDDVSGDPVEVEAELDPSDPS
jgi:hypothetical protein